MSFYFLLPEIFLAGGHAAPDVPLLLVFVQNLPHLGVQGIAAQAQLFRQRLVDGGFGNAEVPGGARTVAPVSIMYTANSQARSSSSRFIGSPPDAVLLEDSMRLDSPLFRM